MSFDPEGYDLDELCDEPLLESRVARLWQGTRDRIALKGEQGALRRAQAKLVLAGTLVGILVWTMWPPSAPSEPRFLALRGGGVPGALAATEERLRVELADGSTVELSAGGRWAPTYNWEDSFESELDRGRVSIDVTPGGPRRWVIRAGGTTIEVLGTRFSVERTPTRTTVSVTRGRVSVRDDRMASRQVVLGAGESVVIRTGTEESVHLPDPVVVPTDSTRRGPSPAGPPRPVVSPGARSRRARDWQELAEGGDHRGAYRELGGAGLRSQASGASPAHLMLLADVARLSGHPREAVAPLERLLREAPEDERAAIGAITLGHIYMDVMHQPARARAALERALALGAPQALRADVEQRLRRLAAEDSRR